MPTNWVKEYLYYEVFRLKKYASSSSLINKQTKCLIWTMLHFCGDSSAKKSCLQTQCYYYYKTKTTQTKLRLIQSAFVTNTNIEIYVYMCIFELEKICYNRIQKFNHQRNTLRMFVCMCYFIVTQSFIYDHSVCFWFWVLEFILFFCKQLDTIK